jgi:hypothetical protein
MKTTDQKSQSSPPVVPVIVDLSDLNNCAKDIIFIKADGSYSKIHFVDQSKETICKTLGKCVDTLDQNMFYRCHRSYFVNSGYILDIDKDNIDTIYLTDGTNIPISIRHKYEILRSIKHPKQSYLNKRLLIIFAKILTLAKY